MTIREVLLPLFAEVILTFVLLFWMAFLRARAITGGATKTRDIALREQGWPELELPMLFYVLTILALDTHHAGATLVALAWLFVLARVIQAVIHVTDNHVRRRGLAYICGAIVLAIMWGEFIMDIVFGT
jgi:hypothetical protein